MRWGRDVVTARREGDATAAWREENAAPPKVGQIQRSQGVFATAIVVKSMLPPMVHGDLDLIRRENEEIVGFGVIYYTIRYDEF